MTKKHILSLFLVLLLFTSDVQAEVDGAETEKTPVSQEDIQNAHLSAGTAGNYLSSQFARTSGDMEKAIRYLRRAHQKNPENINVMSQLQGMLLLNGDIAEAIQLAKDLPKHEEKNSLTSLLLTLDAVKRGDMKEASAIVDDAYASSNGQLWLPLVTAWLDVSRKRLSQPVAIDVFSPVGGQAAALTYYHLALINSQAGFIDEAAKNFKSSIVDPANPPPRIMQMLVRFYNENGKPTTLAPLVTDWKKSNADSKIASEDITLIFTPQDGIAEVLFTMGNVVQSAGSPHDAIIYLHMARFIKPHFPLVSLSLGEAYSDLHQYEKANDFLSAISDKSPLYIKSQLRIAMNENLMGRKSDAMATLDTLADKFPKYYEPLVAKADLLRMEQQYDKAATTYTEALGRVAKFESYHWPLFFARSMCYEHLENWTAAEADMKKALTLKPDQPDVMNYLGYSWLIRRENMEEARGMIEKAINLRPNDPQIADSMGWALYSLAKYADAVSYLEKALELMPADPTINDHLGDVYWQLGRKTEARYQWERALTY